MSLVKKLVLSMFLLVTISLVSFAPVQAMKKVKGHFVVLCTTMNHDGIAYTYEASSVAACEDAGGRATVIFVPDPAQSAPANSV